MSRGKASHTHSSPVHRNAEFLWSKFTWTLFCNVKCCALKWMHKHILRQGPGLAFRLSSPEPSHVTSLLSLGVLTEWFLPRLWRGGGALLTTQTHTLRFWATPISNCPRTLPPPRAAAEAPPQEWKAAETASHARVAAGIGNKTEKTVCFHFKRWHRKDFTFHTFFF